MYDNYGDVMRIIEVKNLCKEYKIAKHNSNLKGYIKHLFSPKYRTLKAVNEISFSIEEGEIVGYLGENGAGKSTTIKMLTGLLTPTSGEVRVNGIIPYKQRVENNYQIGAVFGQKTQLWWDLPVIESFRLIGDLYKIPKEKFKENLEWMIQELELQDLLQKQVRNLSLGQKMKCEIAATFLHQPKVVYLDEPTIGLDVLVKENIRRFIKNVNQKFHTTVILTTHDIKDVEELCDRILLIDQGKLIYDGNITSFRLKYSSHDYVTIYKQETHSLLQEIEIPKEIEILEENKNYIKVKYRPDEIQIIEIIEFFNQFYTIENIETNEEKFEELLKEVYRGHIHVS